MRQSAEEIRSRRNTMRGFIDMLFRAESSMAERPTFQSEGGGSIPTSALHFSVSDGPLAREFIRRVHYSGSCPPSKFYFVATHGPEIVGAIIFRKPSLPGVQKAYSADLELVRLAMLDSCDKNSESRFIGWSLRWLRKHTEHFRIVSFSDPRFGHSGGIYRACNFHYFGKERGHGTRRVVIDGNEFHPKSVFDAYGCSGKDLQKQFPDKKIEIFVCPPKHVFLFDLKSFAKSV